jgi:GTP-binding protein
VIAWSPPRNTSALATSVRAQTLAAVEEASCIVCVLDGDGGLAPEDRETIRLLRRSGKPVVYAVNKLDTPARAGLLHDFHGLGVAPLLAVSAAHGRGFGELLDAVVARLPAGGAALGERVPGTRLALIGRPNVGKSSLLNRLVGAERAIVAPEAGTTRDAIDTPIVIDGRPYVLIDTAGIRRRGRIHEPLERHGAVRALGTLARTDLALIVLDAVEGMTDQDARLVGRAWEAGRGVVLLANKWDAVPHARRNSRRFRDTLVAAHPAFAPLPLLCVSARTGEGLADLFPAVRKVERSYTAALATPALNRVLEAAVSAHPPPAAQGRAVRLLYATQTADRPPTVTIFASAPRDVPDAYVRYLRARFTQAFELTGVPLRIHLRARRSAANPRRPPAKGRPPRARPPRGRGSRRTTRAPKR